MPAPGGPQSTIEVSSSASIIRRSELAFADDVLLANVFVQRARPHAGGQGRAGDVVLLGRGRLVEEGLLGAIGASGARHTLLYRRREVGMDADYYKTLFDYSYWARDKLFGAMDGIPSEEFERDVGLTYGSLQAILRHGLRVENLYRNGNAPGPNRHGAVG